MFFGSKTACAFFCLRILRFEIDSELSAFLAAYFDDLSVHSLTFDHHLSHLKNFLDATVKYNLKINLPKSVIAASEVKSLCVLVSAKGIRPVRSDVDAILRMPHPTNRTEVRALLGMTGFYREFIPDYATVSAPLAALTAGSGKVSWETPHEQAFSALKSALASQSILALPITSSVQDLRRRKQCGNLRSGDASSTGQYRKTCSVFLQTTYTCGEELLCYRTGVAGYSFHDREDPPLGSRQANHGGH